ncbi:MAG TPA: ABC transporter ATP-binding protein [Candidatus Brachybacterium merdigallinarum]|nr:ABC transporter ATP-binding protein [Candidatus Brachybacterium merdigallinarum]
MSPSPSLRSTAGHGPVAGPLFRLEDLHVRFAGADEHAVSGAGLEVAEGEVLAVVGESGSGKSVSIMAALGLLPESAEVSGSATFRGAELIGADSRQLREVRGSRIAMIFQDPSASLDPVFTVGHQIQASVRRHSPGLSERKRRARAVELLESVGIPDAARRSGDYPHQFSGGQLQRIMIAISLAAEPELLIADEPTTALDVTVQLEILELLRRLNRERGTAVLIITHDMGVVADIAHRVVVMRHGRIIEQAPVRTLFARPQHDYTRTLLGAVPTGVAPTARGTDEPRSAVLEVSDLSIRYRTRFARTAEIVSDVSFRVESGEVLGLVGESGSGKTSIARSLIGLAPLSAGTVRFEGTDLATAPRAVRRAARSRIGTVFQNPSGALNPRLSIGDSIAEPLRAHGGFTRLQIQVRVHELLEQVRLPPSWVERAPHELSGGQKQRVAIARALSLRPRLLVADEPTSSLDVSVQAEVLDLLRRLKAELQFGCLLISHDLLVVQEMCEQVLVLRGGRIVEQGSAAAVLTAPESAYTRRLVLSAPVPDPEAQQRRRELALASTTADAAG